MAGFFGQVLCVEVTGRCSVSEEGFGRGRRRFEFEGMIPTYARKTLHIQCPYETRLMTRLTSMAVYSMRHSSSQRQVPTHTCSTALVV